MSKALPESNTQLNAVSARPAFLSFAIAASFRVVVATAGG
jgi:hypothetical protein